MHTDYVVLLVLFSSLTIFKASQFRAVNGTLTKNLRCGERNKKNHSPSRGLWFLPSRIENPEVQTSCKRNCTEGRVTDPDSVNHSTD